MLLLLSGFFLIVGNTEKKDGAADWLQQKIVGKCFRTVMSTMLPILTYEETDTDIMQGIVARIWETIIPVGVLSQQTNLLSGQIESDISYESILAWEASDENDGISQEASEAVSEAAVSEEKQEENQEERETAIETPEDENVDTAAVFQPATAPVNAISLEKLNDFDYLIHNFYVVDSSTTITGSQLSASALLEKNMKITSAADAPQILIYHTHSQERYADSDPNDKNQSVLGVGERLAQILREQYGFHVLHHMGEYDIGGRNDAYAKAGPAVEQILRENPGIQVVIDLHRDGVPEGTHLVTQAGGVSMASIMFFNGLSRTTALGDIGYLYNPYIQDNLAFSLQMQIMAETYYPGFSRQIYLKGYRYNMHYCPRSLLVEVGAQTNTVEEAMNAMGPLADILAKVVGS